MIDNENIKSDSDDRMINYKRAASNKILDLEKKRNRLINSFDIDMLRKHNSNLSGLSDVYLKATKEIESLASLKVGNKLFKDLPNIYDYHIESIANVAKGLQNIDKSLDLKSLNLSGLSDVYLKATKGIESLAGLKVGNKLFKDLPNIYDYHIESIANVAKGLQNIDKSLNLSGALKVSSEMSNLISKLKITHIDIESIGINNDGIISYRGQDIDVNETTEEMESILKEKSSDDSKVEKINNNNFIIILLLVFMSIITSLCIFNKNSVLEENNIDHEINEEIDNGIDNTAYALNEFANNVIHIYVYCEKFYKNNQLTSILIGLLCKKVYKFIISKKNDFKYSKEIVQDEKRKVKFIKRKITRLVQKECENSIFNIIKKFFRLTTAKNIEVKTGASVKSPIIYKLKNTGRVIEILKKNKKWTKIMFEGEDGKEYIGWVFTRYIDKIIN